jgi:methylisocitrate lyase
LNAYATIRRDGTQQAAIPTMQTREELYRYLDYYAYEQRLDRLFAAQRARAPEA